MVQVLSFLLKYGRGWGEDTVSMRGLGNVKNLEPIRSGLARPGWTGAMDEAMEGVKIRTIMQ
jgi:hypothetical protein